MNVVTSAAGLAGLHWAQQQRLLAACLRRTWQFLPSGQLRAVLNQPVNRPPNR